MRTRALVIALAICGLLVGNTARAQKSRVEEIQQARLDKRARLWPERESPMVRQTNQLLERGALGIGLEDGKGANGPQFVLGGTRSGQGTSVGIGYRKTDFWHERLGIRTTARATFQKAVMLDATVDFHGLRKNRTFVNIYAKYETSPQMDFFGRGPFSREQDRSSFRLEDVSLDVNAGVELSNNLRVGVTGGGVWVDAGTPTPERPDASPAPGFGEQINYDRWGGFAAVDNRDSKTGPRSGFVYGFRFRQYFDRTLERFSFRQGEIEGQHYFPYFNKTRVIALRAAVVMSWENENNEVPIYFMPSVGGNGDLRGFARSRFYDNHAVFMSAEHRWYIFRGLDMAVFVDAGKVIPRKADIGFSDLEFSGGIGFRTRIEDTVVMRNDFAVGPEGFRWMWTFSDIFKVKY